MTLWPRGHMMSRDKSKIKYLLLCKSSGRQTWQSGHLWWRKLTHNDPLITWSREVTWQIENLISPLPQGLSPPNMAVWGLMVRGTYLWIHMTFWQRGELAWGHVTNWKQNRRRMATKFFRVLTYGEQKLMMKSHCSDPVIIRSHVLNWKLNILFYKAYTIRVGRVVTYGDRKPRTGSYDSLTMQFCEVKWKI